MNDVAYISGPCRCWHFCLCWWLCVNNRVVFFFFFLNMWLQQKEATKNARNVFFPGSPLFAVISFIFRDEHICPTSFSFTSIPVQQHLSWNLLMFVRIVCDTLLRGQLLYFLTDKFKTAVEKCTGGIRVLTRSVTKVASCINTFPGESTTSMPHWSVNPQ